MKAMTGKKLASVLAVLVGVVTASETTDVRAQDGRKAVSAPINLVPQRGAAPILNPLSGPAAAAQSKFIPLRPIPTAAAATTSTPQPIIGGVNTNGYANVGKVLTYNSNGNQGLGTGTLVAANWMLTAGHMFDTRDKTGRPQGQVVGMSFDVGGVRYWADWATVHPWYGQSYQTTVGPLPYGDIALVRLSRSVPSNIKPAYIQTVPGTVGQQLTIVGYGYTGSGTQGSANGSSGVKRVGVARVEAVAQYWLLWRFDQNEQYSTAHGDSGGPQFNSSGVIVSITTGGNGKGWGNNGTGWGNICWNTRCDVYLPWMRSVVSQNSASAVPTGVRYLVQPERAAGDALNLLPTLPIINFDPMSLMPAQSLE